MTGYTRVGSVHRVYPGRLGREVYQGGVYTRYIGRHIYQVVYYTHQVPGYTSGCTIPNRVPGYTLGCTIPNRVPGYTLGCNIPTMVYPGMLHLSHPGYTLG